ncbi:MAG: HAMP domain-containing histidine kinase [Candidatus Doudnabacteria bacterium]|nr:HAMP domain-containing histidine kinase [Candidatus Doudnabacteria bacterium]
MKQSLFHSATLRLTAWYTVILFFISLLFSMVVYQISSHELQRGFGPPRPNETIGLYNTRFGDDVFQTWREQRIEEGRSRLIGQLVVFNLAVLSTGAAGSYFLARRTLKPVEEALESQTRFSSDAAHELRTPLTIMQSEIEVGLRNKKATTTDHMALLQSNLDEIEHMRTLTDRLLMLANNHEIVLGPTSLESVAIEAFNHYIALAQTKHITIENNVGALEVMGNEHSLTDALGILIENAIKYSPEKARVSVSAVAKGRQALLQVSDTGPGITPEDLPHIFNRFYRTDISRSSQNTPGHGLGLSIAKQIIDAHHGRISAHNNPKDKGATFTISLPIA